MPCQATSACVGMASDGKQRAAACCVLMLICPTSCPHLYLTPLSPFLSLRPTLLRFPPTQDLVHAKGRMDEETPLHLAAAEVRVVDVKGKEGERKGGREGGRKRGRKTGRRRTRRKWQCCSTPDCMLVLALAGNIFDPSFLVVSRLGSLSLSYSLRTGPPGRGPTPPPVRGRCLRRGQSQIHRPPLGGRQGP